MTTKNIKEQTIKFFLYIVVIVLINFVGATLFFRVDLTSNKMFSISNVSKNTVSTLAEPLTINVFITKDLPSPHNNTKQYLQDLLSEYDLSANNYFNYKFYDISLSADSTEESKRNKDLAESYGIDPVQIQSFEQDEIKFKTGYIGLVIIHGDLIEKMPAITTVEGLEYKLTMAMKKLNNKISALRALKEKISIELYMSSSLKTVAPYMRLNELNSIPDKIEETVKKINQKNYGRLEYQFIDPSVGNNFQELVKEYNLMAVKWGDIDNGKIKADEGAIGLVLKYGGNIINMKLLTAFNLPIIGQQYELIDMATLDDQVNGAIESLIDINEKIGYLSDHGTLSRHGGMGMMGGQQTSEVNSFNTLLSQGYSIKDVDLKEDGIPSDINSLIIANPTESFTDYELYQVDQALMSGKSLTLFLDAFNEVQQPNRQFGFNPGPSYQPLNTGLEKLLKHYGITVKKSYVMDENCFKQNRSQRFGGGQQKIYFAPIIENENINNDLEFMSNIKGLITMKASPVEVDESLLKEHGVTAHKLFSSSDESWEMSGRINLNPMLIKPPSDEDSKESHTLAYMLEGTFPSYFAGKEIPVKETPAQKDETDEKKEKPADLSSFEKQGGFIAKSKSAKITIVSSVEMLKDNMLDDQGVSPNAMFIMNLIDAVNGREGIATMRSKKQAYNPLKKISAMARMSIKTFSITGLPVIVIVFGMLIWMKRRSRRKSIQMIFQN